MVLFSPDNLNPCHCASFLTSGPYNFIADRSSIEETEKSLKALIKLSGNPECVTSLVEGLGNYMKVVVALTEQADSSSIENGISQLFNTIIQVKNMHVFINNCSQYFFPFLLRFNHMIH